MQTRSERLTVQMSGAELQMLEHLAMAERVPKAFIIRRLVRDAARELYAVIAEALDHAGYSTKQDKPEIKEP